MRRRERQRRRTRETISNLDSRGWRQASVKTITRLLAAPGVQVREGVIKSVCRQIHGATNSSEGVTGSEGESETTKLGVGGEAGLLSTVTTSEASQETASPPEAEPAGAGVEGADVARAS